FLQGLDEATGLRFLRVVRSLVFLGVLGQDLRRLEVSVACALALDDGAPTLAEQIGRRTLVAHRHVRLAVGDAEGEVERRRLPLEGAALDQAPQAIGLARHRCGRQLRGRDEVDRRLRDAGPDEIAERQDDDGATDEEFRLHWSGGRLLGSGRGWPVLESGWLRGVLSLRTA